MQNEQQTNRVRLGQFADLADLRTLDLGGMLDGWDELDDVARRDRARDICAEHAVRLFALSTDEVEALTDEQRIALVSSLSSAADAVRFLDLAVGGEGAADATVTLPTETDDAVTPVVLNATTSASSRPVKTFDVAPVAADAETETPEPVTAAAGDEEPEPTDDAEVVTADGYTDDRWHCVLFCEGVATNDGRMANPGSINTRPLPLPMQYTTVTGYGHEGALLGGQIDSLTRDPDLAAQLVEGGFLSLAEGALLLVAEGGYVEGDNGTEFQGLVNRQELRFVSADLEILSAEETLVPGGDPDNWSDYVLVITSGNVMGGTACPFPAFQQCVIAPASMSLFDAATQGITAEMLPAPAEAAPVAVAAAGGPMVPPADWFRNPRFGTNDVDDHRLVEDPEYPGHFACPVTIIDDERIYGHAAAWHRNHIGYGDRRVNAPRSVHDYAYFATGTIAVVGDDGRGDIVRCGVITMDTGHADLSGSRATAQASKHHYDHTGLVVADVEIGEDEHGIWFAGCLRPDIPDEKLRALRASSLSGDWRPIGNTSELVGLLAVNVPGFPIPRPRRSYQVVGEDEQELALVAAGLVPPRDPIADLVHREINAALAPIRSALDALTPLAREFQSKRLGQ